MTHDPKKKARPSDADAPALEPAGFVYCQSFGVDMFLDGPDGRPTQAVHLLFAGEQVRAGDAAMTPQVDESEFSREFRVVSLSALELLAQPRV